MPFDPNDRMLGVQRSAIQNLLGVNLDSQPFVLGESDATFLDLGIIFGNF